MEMRFKEVSLRAPELKRESSELENTFAITLDDYFWAIFFKGYC